MGGFDLGRARREILVRWPLVGKRAWWTVESPERLERGHGFSVKAF